MKKLLQLLNSLIAKGWNPFGDVNIAEFNQIGNTFVAINYDSKVIGQPKLRQITSTDSLLWQFCVENGMIKSIGSEIEITNMNEGYGVVRDTDYQYRLIESALKNEDELEEFLLDNIKINE